MRNRTSDLRIPRSDALPVSHRDSTVSEVYYEVHHLTITHGKFFDTHGTVTTFVNTPDGFDIMEHSGDDKKKVNFRCPDACLRIIFACTIQHKLMLL